MQVMPFARFWSKVDDSGDCWEWIAGKDSKGYGNFWFEGRTIAAHRMAYELAVGEVPADGCVLHQCDNPACVRPDHLFIGSLKDNSQDMVAKKRHGNQKKRVCPRNHKYDKKNTRFMRHSKTGSIYRVCRACAREKYHECK